MKIVSGGQTGVDTAALEFARVNGLSYGGWVPKGRTNEAGLISPDFDGLIETQTENVAERTKLNVISSDATLVFVDGSISLGTQKTVEFSEEAGKPYLVVDIRQGIDMCAQKVRRWLQDNSVSILNVAGPRASESPELGPCVGEVLSACFDQMVQPK